MTMQTLLSLGRTSQRRLAGQAAQTISARAFSTTFAKTLSMTLASILSLGLLVGACSGCNKGPAPAAPGDTTVAATPAPSNAAPAPGGAATAEHEHERAREREAAKAAEVPPPPPPPKQYVVPAATPLVVRVGQTISSKASNVGDSFSGTLAQSVVVTGVTVLKAGTPVSGTVTAAKGQGRFKGSGDLGIAIRRVGDYQVTTASYETAAKGKGKRSLEFIGGGGGGGALIGGLAGGGKGALIGGLLGAGAGGAGAAFTGNKDIVVPAETVVTFSLTEPFTVTMDRH